MIKNVFLTLLIIIFSFLAYLSIWGTTVVGDIEFEKILFHMFMPLKKTHTDWAKGLWWPFIGVLITTIVISSGCYFCRKHKKGLFILLSAVLCLFITFDCWYANKHFAIYDFIKAQIENSNFIEQHYVAPDLQKIVFPKEKKNLIVILVESLETSYQDKENGGLFNQNYIPELTELAKQNISFSASNKLEGAMVPPETGWTIAATVSQTAGIPLKLYGSLKTNNTERDIDNTMGIYKYFLPGAVTMGDILEENGYKNYFILGTDARYAGKSDYLKQHGNYKILDIHIVSKTGAIVMDKELIEFAKNELLIISQKQPFTVTLLTLNTHFGTKEDFRTVSAEVSNFVEWIKKQPFYENTTVVVVGDHCNMRQSDFVGLENDDFRYSGNIKRKVYNTFLNSSVIPQKMTDRRFSTLDMFPTILASIGVKIEGERLGLGTNLFSNEKTLMEQYNPSYVFGELKKKSNWYNNNLLYKASFSDF